MWIMGEMVKSIGDAAFQWIHKMCMGKWNSGNMPEDWRKLIIIQLTKNYCKKYKGLSFLNITGKANGRNKNVIKRSM